MVSFINKLLFICLLFSTNHLHAGTTILEDIAFAIQTNNVKKLAAIFDETVEITILTKESSYSKTQAEVVIRDFFSKHTPKSFEFIHDGSSNKQSKYGIGKLVASDGIFRTYVFLKLVNSNYLIQELRFEQE